MTEKHQSNIDRVLALRKEEIEKNSEKERRAAEIRNAEEQSADNLRMWWNSSGRKTMNDAVMATARDLSKHKIIASIDERDNETTRVNLHRISISLSDDALSINEKIELLLTENGSMSIFLPSKPLAKKNIAISDLSPESAKDFVTEYISLIIEETLIRRKKFDD